MGEAKDLLRIGEAAKLLGVAPATLHRWAIAGKVPYFEIGPSREKRFRRADILGLIRQRGAEQPVEQPDEGESR